MKNLIWALVAVVVVVGGWFVLRNKPTGNDAQKNTPIKIGIATILTGDFAAAGENMVNATKLAVQEINNRGGIGGHKLELFIEDAGWESKTGLAAAQKLINVDGVKYIVGGTSSNGTMAATPLANEKHIPYLTPVTGGSNIDSAGEYIFRVANSDLLAGRDIAESMIKLKYRNVATVTEVTEYTLDIKKSFEKNIKNLGGSVLVSEEFQPGTTDFRTIIAKVKSAKPQVILILSQTGVGGAYFVKQSKDIGITAPFFSDFTFVVNENAKNIVGSFEGIYFADPAYDVNDPASKAFFEKYENTYKKPSLIPFHAASSYDSVMLIAKAIGEVGDDSTKVAGWLNRNVKNYKGLMGTYSLDENGNSDLGFVIKVVKDDKFVPVN